VGSNTIIVKREEQGMGKGDRKMGSQLLGVNLVGEEEE